MKEISNHKFQFKNKPKSAVEAIDQLLAFCIDLGASDLHCDPEEIDIKVRIRVDGIVYFVGHISRLLYQEFITRLKILSGTRTDLHFVPQDGRWRATVYGKFYNIRISFMPTYYGENAVLRILPAKTEETQTFTDLGFSHVHNDKITTSLRLKNGLILVTGPTGSGKTTTLRSCLDHIAGEPISIITLEDPVEYEIQNVRQVHIRHDLGVNFASALRSCLRQDPDVIMVGEIRDSETAKIAIHTALTGHLVLSTLHTNSALETIPRLIDMGVDHYLLSSTLRLIISQRLIRKVCSFCHFKTCQECNFTGYKGRAVIAEVLEIDPRLSQMIYDRADLEELRRHIISKGFISIYDDACEKVDWGMTTKAEITNALFKNEKS